MDNFFVSLLAILLVPLLPAFIIYKFLPSSETDVSGPYKQLNVKLKGAFAGYFLLVLLGLGLKYFIMNDDSGKLNGDLAKELAEKDSTIAVLKNQLSKSPVIDWRVKGIVMPRENDKTKFFYDDGTTNNRPDGSFELIKRSIAQSGAAQPPKWICIYNPNTGFKVISLNRELNHPDIAEYNIEFDENEHQILIKNPILVNSQKVDSIVAVANFVNQNAAIKDIITTKNPELFNQAKIVRKLQIQEKQKFQLPNQ